MADISAHAAHNTEVASVESHEDEHYTLTKLTTLGMEVENRDAVKGNEYDGKIDWTGTQTAATVSLAGLYVST